MKNLIKWHRPPVTYGAGRWLYKQLTHLTNIQISEGLARSPYHPLYRSTLAFKKVFVTTGAEEKVHRLGKGVILEHFKYMGFTYIFRGKGLLVGRLSYRRMKTPFLVFISPLKSQRYSICLDWSNNIRHPWSSQIVGIVKWNFLRAGGRKANISPIQAG